MGLKIAVVGGGSTYTPELVEGFAARRRPDADRRAGPARHRPRAARRSSAGWPGGCSTRLDWAGRLTAHRRPRRGARRRRLRADPAACRRAGGAPDRRDAAADVRGDRPGDDRRRRLREGAPDRAGRPRASPSSPPGARRPDAWIVDFTNPVGIVSQALLDAGHRAIGLCNVAINIQRGMAERFGVSPGPGRARARRAQPPDAGSVPSASTASTGCPS